MISEDVLGVFYFAVFWVQPLIWMPLWFVKTRRLDKFGPYLMMLGLVIISGFSLYVKTDAMNLIWFYFLLGYALYYKLEKLGWSFFRAISASFMIVFAGSFYWEIPYLVRNAVLVGFEWDWLVHLIGVIPFLFIRDYIGWNLTRRNVALLGMGILISLAAMWIMPIAPGTGTGAEWNSPLYLFNRLACTLILFNAMNRDWGKLK